MMEQADNKNFRWAGENGYDFHAETGGVISAGARELDGFRKAECFRNHVLGTYRNRPFEILDVTKSRRLAGTYRLVTRTVILVPTAGLDLPNFALLPRRETAALNLIGIKGLDLKLGDDALRDEREWVDEFNRHYSLFAGGAFDAMEASITSAAHLVPDPSVMASVCKPGILRFLSGINTGTIEVRNGYLAVWVADPVRAISPPGQDALLTGRERESLLTVANDLLDVLQHASREAPLRGLTLGNPFDPKRMIGTVVGAVAGFLLGSFIGIVLLFIMGKKLVVFMPVFALSGLALGGLLGKTLMRSK
jgi:hypothetical protein